MISDKLRDLWSRWTRTCTGETHVVLPVPLQASVIVPVEEVCFGSRRAHIRMYSYELEDGSRASLFHTDYDGIW